MVEIRRYVAAALILLIIGMGTIFAFNTEARAAFVDWVRRIYENSIKALVTDNIYNGEITKFIVSVNNEIELKVNSMDDVWYEEDEEVYISFDINDLVVLGDNNEKRK